MHVRTEKTRFARDAPSQQSTSHRDPPRSHWVGVRSGRQKVRGIEMEMRIVAGDSESACVLGDALTAVFGARRVSFRRDDPRCEVRVRGGSDPTVLRVLEAVDKWLNHGGSRSAELWLGERSYTVADQASI